MKTLPPSVFKELTRRLVEEFQPEQVILFGSHAWGTPSEDSDVDLLVIVSASGLTPTARAARAYRCLRGVRVPKDILVKTRAEAERYRHVPASLDSEIFEHGRVLYERR